MLAFALNALGVVACTAEPPPAEPAAVGARAVDFTIEGSDGLPIHLGSYEGDVVLVDLSGFH